MDDWKMTFGDLRFILIMYFSLDFHSLTQHLSPNHAAPSRDSEGATGS